MEVMVTRVKHSIKLTMDSFSTYIIILVYYVCKKSNSRKICIKLIIVN